jgi:plastocyanin
LVQGYLDGQLSRRVFIRRLVATGVSAAAALSYAGLLETTPAAAALIDFYLVVDDTGFQPTPAVLAQGQGAEFSNNSESVHNARDTSGTALFNTGAMAPHAHGFIPPLPGAGVYPYRCDHHTQLKGKLKVPVLATPSSANLGSSFVIRWAAPSVTLPAGRVFDVQRRRPGQTNFTAWRSGVRSKAISVKPTRRGTFAYRARVRRVSNGATTLWSAPATIQVT